MKITENLGIQQALLYLRPRAADQDSPLNPLITLSAGLSGAFG
jgi:hypothetical protein